MDETRWQDVERERLSLADLLDSLTSAQWETQSLCERWRVRDVAAHVAMSPVPEPSMSTSSPPSSGRTATCGGGRGCDRRRLRPTTHRGDRRRIASRRCLPGRAPSHEPRQPAHGPARARAGHHHPAGHRATHADRRRRGRLPPGLVDGVALPRPPADARHTPDRHRRPGRCRRPRRARVQGRLGDLLLLITGRTDPALDRLDGEGTARLRSIPRPLEALDDPPLDGVHHLKLPVTDLTRSIAWYASRCAVAVEFHEDGCGDLTTPVGVHFATIGDPARCPRPRRTRRAFYTTDRHTELPKGALVIDDAVATAAARGQEHEADRLRDSRRTGRPVRVP